MSAGVATSLQTTGTPASVSAHLCSRVHDFPLRLYRRSAAWFSRKQFTWEEPKAMAQFSPVCWGFVFVWVFVVVVVLCYLSI